MIIFKGLRKPLRIAFFEEPIVRMLNYLGVWSARHGRHVVITSLNDHDHQTNSLHYKDRAVDVQVRLPHSLEVDKTAMQDLANYLRANLELGWDVVHDSPGHFNHIHAEWDIRQRAVETPAAARRTT
jgi:hypothetical protein